MISAELKINVELDVERPPSECLFVRCQVGRNWPLSAAAAAAERWLLSRLQHVESGAYTVSSITAFIIAAVSCAGRVDSA